MLRNALRLSTQSNGAHKRATQPRGRGTSGAHSFHVCWTHVFAQQHFVPMQDICSRTDTKSPVPALPLSCSLFRQKVGFKDIFSMAVPPGFPALVTLDAEGLVLSGFAFRSTMLLSCSNCHICHCWVWREVVSWSSGERAFYATGIHKAQKNLDMVLCCLYRLLSKYLTCKHSHKDLYLSISKFKNILLQTGTLQQ